MGYSSVFKIKTKKLAPKIYANFFVQLYPEILNSYKMNYLKNCKGGVAGYIRQKCGRVIDDECKTYLKQRGCKMSISEVMHTKAYGLNDTCKHIIHACGPRWSDYSSKNKCFNDLKNTFFNILIYTETKLKNASSIAIPLISSGIFGVPRSVCCQALFCAVNEYLAESLDENRKLKLIKLTNIDKETCNDLLNYFNDNLNFESANNEKRIIDKNDDKLNRTVSLKKDVAYKSCCICEAKVKSTLRKECGCEYCIDCREMMEQGCDNICQSRKCKKKE
jgi:O-acetyl-ADP-ribose deacetylase (regulator of RNase III)